MSVRLFWIGWLFHLKGLTNSLFFVLVSVLQPIIFASIAFFMVETGNQSGTLLYVALGQTLANTGVAFTVPAEFVSVIKWGVLASMLGKVGRGHDRRRAEYCEERFREGVEACKLILEGWS